MKKKTILGLIGKKASGKGAVADIIIKKYGGTRLTVSNILIQILDILHISVTRENLTSLALILKKEFEPSVLMNAMLKDIEQVDTELIIVDGIRMPGDINPFIKKYGKKFRLIYVDADAKIRYERSKKRGEKIGEDKATFKKFLLEEKLGTEKSIQKISKKADFVIKNNKTEKELEKNTIEMMKKI